MLKPFRDERFREALKRARQLLANGNRGDWTARLREAIAEPAREYLRRIAVKTDDRILFVGAEEIEWIESARNYVVLHTRGATHVVRENLARLESELSPRDFFRISRFALVNARSVRGAEAGVKGEWLLTLNSGAKVACTLTQKELHRRLGASSSS